MKINQLSLFFNFIIWVGLISFKELSKLEYSKYTKMDKFEAIGWKWEWSQDPSSWVNYKAQDSDEAILFWFSQDKTVKKKLV